MITNMFSQQDDGRLQVIAGLSQIERSGLLQWVPEDGHFISVDREEFELYWQNNIDPVFGRLISWNSFAVGAELLAKGMCLVRGVEIRSEITVPQYPTGQVDNWIPEFLADWQRAGTVKATNFGTLGNLVHRDKTTHAPVGSLVTLCEIVGASAQERAVILASYELLTRSIRNRDAHGYVPNVRNSHHHLVPELFARCFNIFIGWLPDGAAALSLWKSEAKNFISLL